MWSRRAQRLPRQGLPEPGALQNIGRVGGKTPPAVLPPAVAIAQLWSDHGHGLVTGNGPIELPERITVKHRHRREHRRASSNHFGVGIEEIDKAAAAGGIAAVVAAGKAEIGSGSDQLHPGKLRFHPSCAVVTAGIVDDDDFQLDRRVRSVRSGAGRAGRRGGCCCDRMQADDQAGRPRSS